MVHIVLATCDLAMDRDDYDESFVATRDMLQGADITFGQLETSFAEKGIRLPQAHHAVLARPEGAKALDRAGFDCISMAGNHCMDWENRHPLTVILPCLSGPGTYQTGVPITPNKNHLTGAKP